MAELPEFVYLVTVEQEGAVSAIAGGDPGTAERVEEEIARRQRASAHGIGRAFFRVWRVPVVELLRECGLYADYAGPLGPLIERERAKSEVTA